MNKELPIARIRPHLLALNLFQVPIGKGCTSVVNQAGVKGVVACCGDKVGFWTDSVSLSWRQPLVICYRAVG